ncbi:MAG: type II toxin-antitoxin system prevent-host-death family antitoxin [Gemmatimonadales bacterium]
MTSVGIRELKNNLSHYVREVVAGRRVTVTDRGRVVALLVPPGHADQRSSRYDELIASGVIRPTLERGDPLADFPLLRLPSGTAADLIDEDRGDP